MSCSGIIEALRCWEASRPKCSECQSSMIEKPRYWECPKCGNVKVKQHG